MPGPETIAKAEHASVTPYLRDYGEAVASFSWDDARRALQGLPAGRGLNAAHEAVDRHVTDGAGDRVAIWFLSRDASARAATFRELRDQTSRFANVLRELRVARGDRVFSLLDRVPEHYVAMLGALKAGAVFAPLLTSFGPKPIRARLALGAARALVTTEALYRRDVEALRRSLPELREVLLVGDSGTGARPAQTRALAPLLARAGSEYEIPPTDPDDPALLHFTSGTTGGPKGAILAHGAVLAHHATGRLALDLHPGDVFWCTADPGWVVGTCYGVLAPLANGVTTVVDAAEPEAERCYRVVQDRRVSVWYTTPTVLRRLVLEGADAAWSYDLSSLRFVACVGDPLAPEAVRWSVDALGRPVHDTWWQTETGAIVLANFAATPIKPGSMGRPLPGARVAVVRRTASGEVEVVTTPEAQGELALDPGWPSMFRGYVGDEARYRTRFAGGYYLSGDLVRRDADGYYWFVGRIDDLIKSSGHLIGPFEVEGELAEHPAIAEVAVIGKPDPIAHERVKAFVVVKRAFDASDDLRRELLGWARSRLGPEVAPVEVEFVTALPRTPSGKIMRRLLKAREHGLASGEAFGHEEGSP
jgi:acetyl-CoA synthetase